jgi:hypothetical protein
MDVCVVASYIQARILCLYLLFISFQEVKCPNEAEFQAYDILLNLNEGDTLRFVRRTPYRGITLVYIHELVVRAR